MTSFPWLWCHLFLLSNWSVTLNLHIPGHTWIPLIRFLDSFPVFSFQFSETDDSGCPVVDSAVGLSPPLDSLNIAQKVSLTVADSQGSVFTDPSVFLMVPSTQHDSLDETPCPGQSLFGSTHRSDPPPSLVGNPNLPSSSVVSSLHAGPDRLSSHVGNSNLPTSPQWFLKVTSGQDTRRLPLLHLCDHLLPRCPHWRFCPFLPAAHTCQLLPCPLLP